MAFDLNDIGWWIQSTDEEIYGPVSRRTLFDFLQRGAIGRDTLVRHSLAAAFAPLAEQTALNAGVSPTSAAGGDKLGTSWPRDKAQRRVLGEDSLPCSRHERLALEVCPCCLAPYCEKCSVGLKRPHFFCKHCQKALYNRRGFAYVLDIFLLMAVWMVTIIPLTFLTVQRGASKAAGTPPEGGLLGTLFILIYIAALLVFVFRDSLLGGAGPGKRAVGLRVFQRKDPDRTLSHAQAFIRAIPLYIPFMNLVDLSVPYRDPQVRRYGDRWADTTVMPSAEKLGDMRHQTMMRLQKKVQDLPQLSVQSPGHFLQLVA